MNKFPILLITTILISIAQPQKTLANTSIEQKAQKLYQQNQFPAAIDLLHTAIRQYQTEGDLIGRAIALRNLALVYQQMGEWSQAETTLVQAEATISNIEDRSTHNQLLAQLLEVRGQIELSLGRSQNALSTWTEAASLYQKQDNLTGFTQAKIYQTYALQSLGLYSQAIKNLTAVQTKLENQPDTLLKAQALLNLGKMLSRTGKYTESEEILNQSLNIALKLAKNPTITDIMLNLGNNARLKSQPKRALNFYQQALDIASGVDILRVRLARLDTLVSLGEKDTATQEVQQIEQLLTQFRDRQTTLQGKVSLARNLIQLEANPTQITSILVSAIQAAKNLGIKRVEADALGVLGNLYENNQKWQEAKVLTEKALLVSQSINARELTYQWQWQLGRIFKAQGETEKAIAAYNRATNNLQTLRGDLAAVSSNLRYSFREQIEPVYRELAELLLQPDATQIDLDRARQVIEALQVAELDNFFRDACLDTQPVRVDRLDPNAAIFYTIILGNRLEVITAIPDRPLIHHSRELPPSELEIVFNSAKSQISRPRRFNLQLFQQAYDWLIRPIEANLEANEIDTLVFVPDGILRNLPPSTYHDGERYLIEKYGIAIAPSLQLLELKNPTKTPQEILLAGLSQSRQGFASLPGVKREIEQIQPLFRSEVLLDNSFTEINFNRSLDETPFRLVHLATHGQFSSNAEETFVLTWDERINIDELNSLLRGDSQQLRPVDLLVLSACETATGDSNSILGLAGIAVRGGARSTVASLWAVDDESTVVLMTNFYRELVRESATKAEALRQAQISILSQERFSHPFFWSAFILVGNWQ